MRRLGWIEGQNVVVVRREADGKYDRMPAFAQELVDAKVDVIVTSASPDAEYAKRLTSTLPIAVRGLGAARAAATRASSSARWRCGVPSA
jgi:putative ABC transport system substrate-binding protein